MGQIDLFENYLCSEYLKLYKYSAKKMILMFIYLLMLAIVFYKDIALVATL